MNNGQIYIGSTPDLKRRFQEHTSGRVFTTKKYLPLKLVYYESYLARKDAGSREYMLKNMVVAGLISKRDSNTV